MDDRFETAQWKLNICESALKGMISGCDESSFKPEKEDLDNLLIYDHGN